MRDRGLDRQRMVVGVSVVHPGDHTADRAVAVSPGITNKDPTVHCWPWERAKFQIPSIVSSECVSLAHITLKNHNFGIEFKRQNKKPSGNRNPGEASMPLWGKGGEEDVSE